MSGYTVEHDEKHLFQSCYLPSLIGAEKAEMEFIEQFCKDELNEFIGSITEIDYKNGNLYEIDLSNDELMEIAEKFWEIVADKRESLETNSICPRCGASLYKSDIPEYKFVCCRCDENFYGFEALDSDEEK